MHYTDKTVQQNITASSLLEKCPIKLSDGKMGSSIPKEQSKYTNCLSTGLSKLQKLIHLNLQRE